MLGLASLERGRLPLTHGSAYNFIISNLNSWGSVQPLFKWTPVNPYYNPVGGGRRSQPNYHDKIHDVPRKKKLKSRNRNRLTKQSRKLNRK